MWRATTRNYSVNFSNNETFDKIQALKIYKATTLKLKIALNCFENTDFSAHCRHYVFLSFQKHISALSFRREKKRPNSVYKSSNCSIETEIYLNAKMRVAVTNLTMAGRAQLSLWDCICFMNICRHETRLNIQHKSNYHTVNSISREKLFELRSNHSKACSTCSSWRLTRVLRKRAAIPSMGSSVFCSPTCLKISLPGASFISNWMELLGHIVRRFARSFPTIEDTARLTFRRKCFISPEFILLSVNMEIRVRHPVSWNEEINFTITQRCAPEMQWCVN